MRLTIGTRVCACLWLWPCSVAELAAKSGLPQSDLLDLVARYPAMATLDTAGTCVLVGGCVGVCSIVFGWGWVS